MSIANVGAPAVAGLRWARRFVGAGQGIYEIDYAGGWYVGGSYWNDGASLNLYRTQDGISWQKVKVTDNLQLVELAQSGSTWLALTDNGSVFRSVNSGGNWTLAGTVPGIGSNGTYMYESNTSSIVYSNGTWVFITGTTAYHSSNNGTTWSSNATGSDMGFCDLGVGNGVLVAVGGGGEIRTSANAGQTWTKRTSGTDLTLNSVAFGNGRFVVVGSNGLVLTSTDNGTTWVSQASGSSSSLRSVSFGNNVFVRSDGYVSADGIAWSAPQAGWGYSNYDDGVVYGNAGWLMGSGGVYQSVAGDVPTGSTMSGSLAAASGTIGQPLSYKLSGALSFSPTPTQYAAVNLPSGFSINSASGDITSVISEPSTAASQTISAFTTISAKAFGALPFNVSAPSASSGLPVELSVKSGPASINGNTVTLTGVGIVLLAANQAGNVNYDAAPEVTTSFIVSPPLTPVVDWKSPTNRQFSMTLYATIQDQGVIKSHPLSLLAAFDENGCTGVAEPLNAPYSNVFTLTISSDTNKNEVFDLKYYDGETGKILHINEQIRFEKDKIVGSIPSPEALTVAYEEMLQKIPVVKGWNWISFSVLPLDSTVSKLLKDYVPEDNDVLKGQKGFATFFKGKWYPESYEIEAARMYALQRQNPNSGEIAALGGAVDLGQQIKLVSGWNWLGFPMQADNSIKDALTSLNATNNDVLKSQVDGTITFLDGKWLPENRRMFPGRGYMLRTEKAQNFSYMTQPIPYNLSGLQAMQVKLLSVGAAPNWVKPEGLENNMVLYATVKVDGKAVEAPGSLLAAFDGESISGVATIQDGPQSTKLYQLQVWSNNGTKEGLVLKSYNSETGKIYSLSPSIKFQSDSQIGEISVPVLFTYSTPPPPPTPTPAPSGGSGSVPAKKGKGAKKPSASKSAKSKSSPSSAAKKSGAKKPKKK
jgi:hypothetical protein